MASYHIKDDGSPGLCRAAKNACPKGGQHFASEEEARAAVEVLFGSSFQKVNEPLAVYSKKAIRQQFKDARRFAVAPEVTWASHFNAVEKLLLSSRLDVREQNMKVKADIEEKLKEVDKIRNDGSLDEDERLDAAMSQHLLANALGEHYGFKDTRTAAQIQADEAYAENWAPEGAELDYKGVPTTLYHSSEADLSALVALTVRAPEDLSQDEREIVQKLNPQASKGRLFEKAPAGHRTPLEDHAEAEKLLAQVETVPPALQQHLRGHVQPAALKARMAKDLQEITTISPVRFGSSTPQVNEGVNIFDAAAVHLRDRRANNGLKAAVLNS